MEISQSIKFPYLHILASSVHSHPTIYNNGQHLPNRASFGCESVPELNDNFHQDNNHENPTRFDFDYNTSATDEDELLDVIAKYEFTIIKFSIS